MARKPKTSVNKSRHRDEIIACLQSGWSPRSIVAWLKHRYGDDPDIPDFSTIERWRKRYMPEAVVVPPSIIREKLKGVDYKVNLLQLLSRLIPLLELRVARALELEKDLQFPSPMTDKAVETYLETLDEWKKAAQALGEFPSKEMPISLMQQNVLNLPPEVGERIARALELPLSEKNGAERLSPENTGDEDQTEVRGHDTETRAKR